MTYHFACKTLRKEVFFEGEGIHTGSFSKIVVSPGNNGIGFWVEGKRYPASPNEVTDTMRCITLGPLRTVEHLLSALAITEITDAEIEVEGEELPILDGGSLEYTQKLLGSGIENTGKKKSFSLFSRVHVRNGEESIDISLGEGKWRYEYDAGERFPGKLIFTIELDLKNYIEEIAPAKTFINEEEIEKLQANAMGSGGSAKNTLVLGKDKYITSHRFQDEPARHKMLDLIGDLYLTGIPPRFLNVSASKSGHRLNIIAAKRLQELCTWELM
ncbi:MAG TPA: UDP-3-O-acyl-N-acetylglucosamine deacetylase [Fimbriimonadales bacterium]|nr:UDP-3-O-acyl-N-acetylglucosamine deacetylase [Fimbriimonadales bacterium]